MQCLKSLWKAEVFDCVICAVDSHSGYIVAVLGKTYKKKYERDKHGVGLQATTVVQAMSRHWMTVFDVPAVISTARGTKFVGALFRTMSKYMGVRMATRWHITAAETEERRLREGNCLKNSGNCILESLAEIGINPFWGFCRHTTIYPDCLVCHAIVFHSYRIQFQVLSHG